MDVKPPKISSMGARWISANTVLLGLATIAVVLRLWARKLRVKTLGFNDYTIILSLIFAAGGSTVQIIAAVHGGVGFNVEQVLATMGLNHITTMLKCLLASEFLYPVTMGLIKVSVLHFYTTIFPGRLFCYAAYLNIALAVAATVATMLDALLGCRPFRYNWDKTIDGTCGNEILAYMIPCTINLAIDLTVVILPFPVVWKLQMRLGRKIAVSLIFSLGIRVCVISALRLKAIYSLDPANITGSVGDFGFWTAQEPLLGITNACLPIMQPVLSKIFNKGNFSGLVISRKQHRSEQPSNRALPRTEKSTLSSNRLFRRLYDHLYPLSSLTLLHSEDRTHVSDHDVEAPRADLERGFVRVETHDSSSCSQELKTSDIYVLP